MKTLKNQKFLNKTILRVLIAMAMVMALAFAASAQYFGEAPAIKVSITSQEPDPVEPGKQVEVSFKVDNEGAVASNVVLEVLPEYPFSLLPGETAQKDIGVLGNSVNTDRSITVKYKLKVDQGAVDGSHELKVRYKYGNGAAWSTVENLFIKVQAHDAILSIDKFATNPAVVSPGSKTELTITLKNYATSALKDVKISLDLGKSGDAGTPFSPLGSTNEKVISFIQPEATETVKFEILADPEAASKSYKLPLTLKYSDLLNKNYSKSNIVTVIVGGEPDVSIGIDSTTIYSAGAAGDITVKIVNKGLPDMKFVNVKLHESDKYRILSPSEIYIGNIDSDDYETADFRLFVEKTSEKSASIPITVEYKDANNKNYKSDLNLLLPLYNSSEAKKLGLVEGGSSFKWVAIILVLVLLLLGYRMWKRRSRKH